MNTKSLTLTFIFLSGEEDVHLHADNCSRQNKNSYVIQVSNDMTRIFKL